MEVEIVPPERIYEAKLHCVKCENVVYFKKLTFREYNNLAHINANMYNCPTCVKEKELDKIDRKIIAINEVQNKS